MISNNDPVLTAFSSSEEVNVLANQIQNANPMPILASSSPNPIANVQVQSSSTLVDQTQLQLQLQAAAQAQAQLQAQLYQQQQQQQQQQQPLQQVIIQNQPGLSNSSMLPKERFSQLTLKSDGGLAYSLRDAELMAIMNQGMINNNNYNNSNERVSLNESHKKASLNGINKLPVGPNGAARATGVGGVGGVGGPRVIDAPPVYTSRKEELQIYYQKCLRGISHSINIIKAVLMRLVFSLHSIIAICFVYLVRNDEWYLVNFIGVVMLLIELFVTIIKRKGKEPRWFFPCFFIYICTMIPPIWFIELTRIDQSVTARRNNASVQFKIDLLRLAAEAPIGTNNAPITINEELNDQIKIDNIAVGFEITLLMLVILGRWFLPKGNISRSTLSQLLLVYMSLASDIVDLLSLLNETQVQESHTMTYFTLAIFSWSLFQFSLNLVVTRGRSFQSTAVEGYSDEIEDESEEEMYDGSKSFLEDINKKMNARSNVNSKKEKHCFATRFLRLDLLDSEIWSILITLIFQDGPFLALRLTAVFKFDVRTFVTMFFTCKNAIILFLQFYRLSAICSESDNNQNDQLLSNKADATASLNAAVVNLDKFVVLSHVQTQLIKSTSAKSRQMLMEDGDKGWLKISPIVIRSSLSRNYSYAIVLTQNSNLSATCCSCDCHPKEHLN